MLPRFLKVYRDDALLYLNGGRVRDSEFSRGTYQVLISPPKNSGDVWTFLQVSGQGQLVDSFCECDEQDENQGCVHLAAAYLFIMGADGIPLHVRFERSFWNFLCFIFSGLVGDDPSVLGPDLNYESQDSVFRAKGLTEKGKTWLKEMVASKSEVTEETSIKFSHLPPEELALWKEGTPSKELKYELSFWSDLAKKMFALDAGPYEIEYAGPPDDLPGTICIRFPDFELTFSFPKSYWLLLIPTLGTVRSPLQVFGLEQEGKFALHFDPSTGEMEVRRKEASESFETKEGVAIDGWTFIPGEGFYPRSQKGLFPESQLKGRRLGELLSRHSATVSSLLVGETLTTRPVTLSYCLVFDPDWNLHISAYAFQPGDLSHPNAHLFGDWLYLPRHGFMPFKGKEFSEVETVIHRDDVNNFVSKSRSFLNAQAGFETHEASLEAQFTYFVDPSGSLRFSSRVAFEEGVESQFDFGQWIYILGEGFYQKSTGQFGLPIKPGSVVKASEVPLFIKMNRDELSMVPGFFTERCPIEKSGLSVQIEDDHIVIEMRHRRAAGYEKADLRFFDEYVYMQGKGFHKLPIDPRIPELYHGMHIVDKERMLAFLSYELKQLKPYIITLDPRLKEPKRLRLAIKRIDEEEDGLIVHLAYRSEQGETDGRRLLEAVKKKRRFVPSPAGLIDLRQERFGWLYQMDPAVLKKSEQGLFLTTLDLLRLMAFDEVGPAQDEGEGAEMMRRRLESLIEFEEPSAPDFSGFKAELRPYQEAGVKWLWFLYQKSLSGLLCDDMGLGKTLQSMALIAASLNERKKRRHYLIVCPTSVIYHWQDKFKAFLPKCRVFTFYGSQRSLAGFREEYDVLLTSYGIWRREREILGQIPFEVAVLDEIQMAKNPRSKLHASLMQMKAKMKIGLTGTPIENYLRELKALFDIVLPGYMPGPTDFRDFFILPIEKQHNKKRLGLLSRMIRPFTLRRKKEDVLFDLPEKIEEITDCPLLPQQQALYQETLDQSRASILRELESGEESVPYLHVFALLSRLKQICNHPAVYYQNPKDYDTYQSGKWERFKEILEEVQEGNQKVVIFSQYLTQLDIIEAYLKDKQIGYAGIRGSTIKRDEELKRFHQDPNCQVFVASLQAAGLGIDLTPASVVIHYDRWWNAARENQATDRVHRIGQERGVQVFKLVTRGTFEEKIHTMIERKGQLMEDVVGVDDQALIKRLSREDLFDLLQDAKIGKDDQMDVIKDD